VIASIRPRLAGISRTGKIVMAVAAAAAVGACCAVIVAAGPGTPVPDRATPLARGFALPELGRPGHTVSLAAYPGDPVIVNFFASWCSPCQRETPMLARFYESQRGKVLILGIDSNDESAAALSFVHRMGVGYPVGFDAFPATVTTSYGVYALPQTFFLNDRHRIVSRVMGPVTMADLTRGVAAMDRSHQERS
jgi:cytochrome c biogenesis protein CcmG, thiol:disulfide interchange protein DsbE